MLLRQVPTTPLFKTLWKEYPDVQSTINISVLKCLERYAVRVFVCLNVRICLLTCFARLLETVLDLTKLECVKVGGLF